MTALIFKYNLPDQQWCDNRTIEEVEYEFNFKSATNVITASENLQNRMRMYHKLLRGEVVKHGNSLYALSKSAIEECIK